VTLYPTPEQMGEAANVDMVYVDALGDGPMLSMPLTHFGG